MGIQTYIPDQSRIVHVTKVDFGLRKIQEPIHLVQYDNRIPIIAVSLYINGGLFVIPAEDTEIKVRWAKKDHTFIYKDILGCNVARTVVYFEVDEQMSYYDGAHNPILELLEPNGANFDTAGSSSIPIIIDRNPVQQNDVVSQSQIIDISANEIIEINSNAKIKIWVGTQTEYDSIAIKTLNVLYLIVGALGVIQVRIEQV